MRTIKFLIGFVFLFFLISFSSSRYFFPGDILNNLPSFSEAEWTRPQNSLLADPVYQFEPWRKFSKEELLSGHFPLWNMKNGNGSPFFANPQTAVLFPLNFFYYIFSLNISLVLIPLSKIILFSFFSYLYFRSIKIEKDISIIGALFCLVFPFMILWIEWPHTNVFLFLPLILYASEKIHASIKNRHRNEVVLIFAYTFAIFGGHPETLFEIFLVHAVYVLLRKIDVKNILIIIRCVLLGFLLGSIQLLPFIEYLLNSYALMHRSAAPHVSSLPIASFVLNIFPFILGAPQLEFYKPLFPFVNFQETTGGYTGLLLLFLVILGIHKYKNNAIMRIWAIIGLFSLLLSYDIISGILIQIPLFRINANQRMVGVMGFSVIVLAVLFLQNTQKKELFIKIGQKTKSILLFMVLILVLIDCYILFSSSLLSQHPFTPFIFGHIQYILFSSLFGVYIFVFTGLKIKRWIIMVLVLSQIIPVVFTYNPFISSKDYYPTVPLIELLKQKSMGTIIEVGNPNLPADVNLFYDIPHVVNNDAIEIFSFRKEFDMAFPIKNMWNYPDEITYDSLRQFGIKYVISDYDIRLSKKTINSYMSNILLPIDANHPVKIPVSHEFGTLSQIRFLPATFNRINNCDLDVSIVDSSSVTVYSTQIKCQDFRNYMFFTLSVPKILLAEDEKYLIQFISYNAGFKNNIALVGKEDKPYLELLYEQDKNTSAYRQVGSTKYVKLFEVNESSVIELDGSYKIIKNDNNYLAVDIVSQRDQQVHIAKTFYPGWKAKVDGKPVLLAPDKAQVSIFVPFGKHIVELLYFPLPFFIGCIISFVALLGVCIYYFRMEKQQAWVKRIDKKWIILSFKIGKIFWWEHAVIFTLGILAGLLISWQILSRISIHFSLPYTTGINWLTVNHYPKQQDLFYVVTSVIITMATSLLIWYLWIKR